MKIVSREARLGNFFVVEKAGDRLSIVGGTEGYALYDDAEAQLKRHKKTSSEYVYLILQVVGEFKVASQLVAVVPTVEGPQD